MKAIRKLVLVAVVLGAGVALSPAFAQSAAADSEDEAIASAPPDAPAASQGQHHDPMASAQKRLTHLKSKLGITGEQEPQWSAFSDTVIQRVAQLEGARRGEKPAALTAPQRIDRRLAWMKQRTAAFEAIGQAAKELYATLSPQQQQIADDRLLRWHHRQRG